MPVQLRYDIIHIVLLCPLLEVLIEPAVCDSCSGVPVISFLTCQSELELLQAGAIHIFLVYRICSDRINGVFHSVTEIIDIDLPVVNAWVGLHIFPDTFDDWRLLIFLQSSLPLPL